MTQYLRTQKITIDLPMETSEPWVNCVLQKVIRDENLTIVQVIDRVKNLDRQLTEFATDIQTITDPVTQQTFQMSGVGLGAAITQFVTAWIVNDLGATLTPEGYIIIGE